MTYTDQDLASLATRVGKALLRASLHVASAESCTGGWIAKAMTDIAGSSQWFAEGFVTYTNDAKHSRLGVPHDALARHGAVSEAVVRAMVRGALDRAGTELAVAVTGIAGPGGAVPGKPVGTVWLSWALRHGRSVRVMVVRRQFRGDRETVRRKTVHAALAGLLRAAVRGPGRRRASPAWAGGGGGGVRLRTGKRAV